MKICMLVSRVPWPLEKGDKLRAYHQLKQLARSHEVHLICLSDSSVDEASVNHLLSITPHISVFRLNWFKMLLRMGVAFFSRKPFQVHYFFERSVAGKIKGLIEEMKPDVIYCQLIRCSEYVKHLHHYRKTIDYMDALSAGQHRRALRAPWYLSPFVKEEARRLTAYEHLIFDYFEHHTIISDQDRKLIYHSQCNQIQVVPNGIDADYFLRNPNTIKKYDLIFTGNMSYPPNVEGVRRLANCILPLVRKKFPQVSLFIAGANPSASVRALAGPGVDVSGWIDDIRDAYNCARIFVAPMLTGSGMQNKLLEAMCMELPCVTTELAAAPLGVTHQRECLIGNSDQELAECIIRLLENSNEAIKLGESGRRYVSQNFDWSETVRKLEKSCFYPNNP
jgi:sugar transferase (PEP-CTERM/EpsH1 system associated)